MPFRPSRLARRLVCDALISLALASAAWMAPQAAARWARPAVLNFGPNDAEYVRGFRDQWRRLMHGSAADPAAATTIVDGGDDFILDYDFSPDLMQVAYTRGREDASCSDLWVADIDGGNQTMLVDCVDADRFVTGVQWVQVD